MKNGDVPSLIYYTLSAADALGRERTATFGNGVNEVRVYDRANGTLQSIASGPTGTPTSVQNLSYQWDAVGNLTQRRDWIQGKTEDFVYDALSRLRTVQVNSATALSVDYDAIGNISYKSDVGSYAYGAGNAGPHAVTSVSGIQSNTYLYDANGNMTNRDGDTTTWYSFNKPLRMNFGSAYSEMTYGVHRQRIKQVAVGYSGGTLRYVGPEFELLTQGPLRADLHHIFANGSAIARYTTYNFQGPDTRYLHRDSLGSIVATSSGTNSTVLSRYEFEAFGLRWQTAGSGLFTQKGFTGHDHLDAVDLIDMVGRVQDPVLGRFLSADPFVQAPYSSQSLNRYSYVWNNPATLTDASGFQTGCWEDYLPLCDPAGLPPALTLPPWWITYDSGFRNPWDLDLQNAGSMPYSGPAPVTRSSAVGPQDATLTRPRFDRAEYLQYADCSAMPVAAPCGLEMELRRGVRSGEITQAQSDAILRDWYENAAKNAALMVVTSVAAELAVAKLAQWFYAARGTGVAGFHPLRSMNPSGSTTNCVNCALALDATLGGNQAVALAGRAVPLSEVPAIFGAEGFTHQLANASALRSLLQGAGDGARGVVVGLRGAGQPAHAFNAVNQGGVVSFLDAQVGGAASLEGYRQFLFIATAGF